MVARTANSDIEEVVDRTQSNKHASQDYEAFMEACAVARRATSE
jgi:hypothetical protein